MQCVRDAQESNRSERHGDGLKLSLMDDYKQLARDGRVALALGRKGKIEKWVEKVNKLCGDHEAALARVMG